MTILDQINGGSILHVGEQLGLEVGRDNKSLGACPCCSAERRSRTDKRLPISIFNKNGRDGWRCFSCGEKGTVVHLISFGLFGERLRKGDDRWRALIEWGADTVLGGLSA